jgi:ATP-dependent protease HslVU (ClpYQ) ATPase subunit
MARERRWRRIGFFYVAEYEKEGKTHFATFTLQGELTEEETDIAVADLPAAVKAGVAKAKPGATIDSASEVVEKGEAKQVKTYAVEVTQARKTFELVVGEGGKVLSSEAVAEEGVTRVIFMGEFRVPRKVTLVSPNLLGRV